MKEQENILSVCEINPAFLGFIFYRASKRYMGNVPREKLIVPEGVRKVGVFVNDTTEAILDKVENYGLHLVQLHGEETEQQCRDLKGEGLTIIKAFSVDDDFDFNALEDYENYVDYFLFDTKGKDYGGNGITFDWEVLEKYGLKVPFFLSGGIDLQHVDKIKNFRHSKLFALDLNSRFETKPGLKDADKLKTFAKRLSQ